MNDYDPDMDFEPLRIFPMKGVDRGFDNDFVIPETVGNTIKAQLEEIWNRRCVALTMHHARWKWNGAGRIIGFKQGTIYPWPKQKRPSASKSSQILAKIKASKSKRPIHIKQVKLL